MVNIHEDSSAKKHGQQSSKNQRRDLSCTYTGHSPSHYWEWKFSVVDVTMSALQEIQVELARLQWICLFWVGKLGNHVPWHFISRCIRGNCCWRSSRMLPIWYHIFPYISDAPEGTVVTEAAECCQYAFISKQSMDGYHSSWENMMVGTERWVKNPRRQWHCYVYSCTEYSLVVLFDISKEQAITKH